MKKLLALTLTSALGGFLIWRLSQHQGEDSLRALPAPVELADPEPHEPPCRFWQPWYDLVSPGRPADYLETVRRQLQSEAVRSQIYEAMLGNNAGVLAGERETVCIVGRFTPEGSYRMDLDEAEPCDGPVRSFLEQNTRIAIDPLPEGGFANRISHRLALQDIRPKSALKFWRQQLGLLEASYRGWSKAYPAYYRLASSSFAPVEFLTGQQGETGFKFSFLGQVMMRVFPSWSTYLLRLGDLAKTETWLEDDQGQRVLSVGLDTVQNAVKVTVPRGSPLYQAAPYQGPVTFLHSVTVRFRGLVIAVERARFEGQLTLDDDRLEYAGRFMGVDQVKVSGSYRGVSLGSLGQMIHEVVEEAIAAEVRRLQHGHDGQGFRLTMALTSRPEGGVFGVDAAFDSPVNFINVLREEKDQTDSPVLPKKKDLQELNQWARSAFEALSSDLATVPCDGLGRSP